MPLSKKNTTVFHRRLYSGILEPVILLKRNDDQQQGTVRSIQLYQCWWGVVLRTGEPIQSSQTSDSRRTVHVPLVELRRVGVAYINGADRFVDLAGRYWNPESTTLISQLLFENHVAIDCMRIDPPNVTGV